MANVSLNEHWVKTQLIDWARALTGGLVNINFVDRLPSKSALGEYKAATGIHGPRIILRRDLLADPDELMKTYFHELGHHLQVTMPMYRQKGGWAERRQTAERQAEDLAWSATNAMRRGARKRGKSLHDLLRMPDW